MTRGRKESAESAETVQAPETYAVLVSFTDGQDGGAVYWAGKSTYPRSGYTPTAERVAQLQGDNNALRRPVIAQG